MDASMNPGDLSVTRVSRASSSRAATQDSQPSSARFTGAARPCKSCVRKAARLDRRFEMMADLVALESRDVRPDDQPRGWQ
jgi:hypothetical protein